jgi:DNA-binding PadR family transcriptional regulator
LRFFRYGELPLVLLALLEREPLNGYELMGELDRLFGPTYVPSAGSVYPALNALETEELIVAIGDEIPKRYDVARTGKQALVERRHKLAEIERRTGAFLRHEGSIDADVDRVVALVRRARGRADPVALRKVLERTQEQLTALLKERGDEGD